MQKFVCPHAWRRHWGDTSHCPEGIDTDDIRPGGGSADGKGERLSCHLAKAPISTSTLSFSLRYSVIMA